MPRGPDDAAIEAQFAGEQVTTVEPEAEPPPRPEGGKPLLRLLELLGSAGYADAVAAAVDLAVGPESRDEFRTRLEEFVSLPPAVLPDEGGAGSSPRAKSRKSADGGTAAISVEELAQAHLDAAEQLGPPTPTGPQWQSIGPWTIPNGQTYGASRVNVSGRIAAIAVDPSNAAHVLAGAANGGVWESFDRGASWAPRTDYAATLAVGAIAFDGSNPSTVYCGLGEGNWWFFLGVGILRSSDGGATWSTLCTAPFVGQGFYDLVVDPSDGTRLYAGTTGGLYVSSDGGVTWTQRRAGPTYSIQITPPGGRGAEVLAACRDGLWRSMNRGTNWNAVGLPSAPASFNRLAVAIAPSDPTIAYAWARGPRTRPRRTCGAVPATTGRCRQPCRASPPASPGTTGSSASRPTTRTRSTAARSASTEEISPARRGRGATSRPSRPATRSTPTRTRSRSSRAIRTRSTSETTAASSARPTAGSRGSTATTGS